MKSVNVLKYLTLVFVILLAAMLALLFVIPNASGEDSDQSLAIGLTAVFSVIVWFVSATPTALALLVTDICLFAVKKKYGATVASLTIMCVTAPVLAVDMLYYVSLCILTPKWLAVPLVTIALWLATFVTCCVAVNQLRKARKHERMQQSQISFE